ncbi:MAG: DUF4249 domain-containing protein [Bacteroidota bacterium]
MKKHLPVSKLIILLFFILSIASCIDPFELKYDLNKSVIIVDAVLSDEIGDQFIIVKESKPNLSGTSSSIIALEKATVEIQVNGSEKMPFTESATSPGNYLGPQNFKAEPNKTYQLLITTAQGKKFQSKIEKLTKGSEIKKIYQKFEVSGKSIDKNYKAVHKIFLDTEDPAGKGNNYLWKWRLFEAQEVCRTCEPQERYYSDPFPGRCVKDLPNFLRNTIYDYQCKGNCWEILHSLENNVMNDDFSDGKTITARLVASVPLYQLNAGALIEVRQQSIDTDAYKYMKILIDQSQNSGGLADTPPVSLVGNITSADGANETVAGYFRVTDESTFRYWIDRTDIAGLDVRAVGLLGRPTNLEPTGTDTTRPPFAPCINGYSRTNIRPVGWQDSK